MIKIIKAVSRDDLAEVRNLFLEYSASLDFSLDFQNFEIEIKNLPGEYSMPGGKLYLALYKNKAAGCIALRKIDNDYCEMKRLFVRSCYRGLKIGKALIEIIINEAKKMNYKFMRLDTVPSMQAASKLYEEFGFKKILPYRYNPVDGAVYMELKLQTDECIKDKNQDYLECSIKFNPWKHHKNYICKKMEYYIYQNEAGIKELKKNLLQTGNSLMDLYIGELSLTEITQNISAELLNRNVSNKELFRKWLHNSGQDYRIILLQDNSQWTLRLSGNDEKFIHIHPARYSLNTIRVRGATLRTAIAVIVISRIKGISPVNLGLINEVRKKFLNESPIKTININSGLGKIILEMEGKN
jgi:ribosomal protein S18 acetylase RimI-like enzyme